MRLIDAVALIEQLESHIYWGDSAIGLLEVAKNAPTIDAEPVVRCRECALRGYDGCPMCHDEDTWDDDDGSGYYTVDNTTDCGFCHMGTKMGGADK